MQFWIDLAKLLESGGFDALFIADVMGVYDVFGGTPDAALRHAMQVPTNDPMLLVPAMAANTRSLGFGVTFSLSYEHPYPFARRMSTLDHLTGGRIGWNIVTGYLESAARNLGFERQTAHDARYDYAEEYLDVVYKLWEASWEDDAVTRDRVTGIFTDPAKVHPIKHQGEHFRVPGIHLCEPSPQRTPFLYQAGTSPRGLAFAGRHAEAVFVSAPSRTILKKQVDGIRGAALAAGRNADAIRIYAQALIVTGPDSAAASRKYDDYLAHIDVEAALALLSGWTGIDFSQYQHDEVIRHIQNEAGRSALASFTHADPTREWTVGEAAQFIGLGGRGPVFVGDAAEVADQLEAWLDETGIDGFNLAFAITPGSFSDVVQYIVPELSRRNRYRIANEVVSLRHKLFNQGDRLAADHPARKVKIGVVDAKRSIAEAIS
jgi:FMN-dependent oxidoreductase (nitrilotriacetate monooxygenase family)